MVETMTYDKVDITNVDFVMLCKKGDVENVKRLINHPHIDLTHDNGYAFQSAVHYGHAEVVKLFLARKDFDPGIDDNFAIKWGSLNAKAYDTIKLLLEDGRANPAVNNNEPLYNAIIKHNYKIVELLLDDNRVDILDRNGQILNMLEYSDFSRRLVKNNKYIDLIYEYYFNIYKNTDFYRIPKFVKEILMKKMKLQHEVELEMLLKIA